MWMFLTLFYGVIKGLREICKKKALEKNSVIEVLLIYTFLSFVIALPQAKNAGGLSVNQFLGIALKAFVIFVAWIASFKAIKKLPISMYGILDLSRVLFATLLGIFVLAEKVTINKLIALFLVSTGLLFLKFNPIKKLFARKNATATLPSNQIEKIEKIEKPTQSKIAYTNATSTTFYIILAFASCMLNAVSGLLDKILMRNMNSSQLQFWYTFFTAIYYAIYALFTKAKITKSVWKNVWIYLLAAGLIIMDKALFIANGYEESQVTIMTLIKQSSVIVALIAGKFVFKEKNILHKVFCATIIVAGILVGVMA